MTKTKRNNFDKSSTGTDIECACQYDTDRSSWEFKENIEILQGSGYSKTSVGYYIDNGNVAGSGDIKFTIKGERSIKEKYFLDNGRYYDAEEIKAWDDETLNDEILSQEEDVNLINLALGKIPSVEGLEFVPNKNLIVLTTKGYSQGDYAKAIYCPDDLEKAWGAMPAQESIQTMVDHYYWDAPIYCRFEIDGKEYSYNEMPDYDEYKWDRDAFLEYVSKESGIDKEKLSEFVPQYPEYA